MFQRIWAGVTAAAAVISCLILIGNPVPSSAAPEPSSSAGFSSGPVGEPISEPVLSSAPSEPSSIPSGYWLRELNGRLAVFRSGEAEPVKVLDFHVAALPEADRAALKKGIFVPDDRSLAQLIEDYIS